MTNSKNKKGFNMFQKRRKKKKQSTLLYVDATNKSYERAISEFKRKVMKELYQNSKEK